MSAKTNSTGCSRLLCIHFARNNSNNSNNNRRYNSKISKLFAALPLSAQSVELMTSSSAILFPFGLFVSLKVYKLRNTATILMARAHQLRRCAIGLDFQVVLDYCTAGELFWFSFQIETVLTCEHAHLCTARQWSGHEKSNRSETCAHICKSSISFESSTRSSLSITDSSAKSQATSWLRDKVAR